MSAVRQQVEAFLAAHDPATEERLEFLQARFPGFVTSGLVLHTTNGLTERPIGAK